MKRNAPTPEQVERSSWLSALILVSISIALFFAGPSLSLKQTWVLTKESLLGLLLGVFISLLNFRSWNWVVGLIIRAATLFTQVGDKKKVELLIRLKLLMILSLKILLILLVVYSLAGQGMVRAFVIGLVGHLLLGVTTLFFRAARST